MSLRQHISCTGRCILLCCLARSICFPNTSYAQDPAEYPREMEELLYDHDEGNYLPEHLLEDQVQVCSPIALNYVSAEQLEASGLLNPFQCMVFVNYRETYGPLFSLYELLPLPGFNDDVIKRLELETGLDQIPYTRSRRNTGKLILLQSSRIFPASAGYKSGPDLNSPAFVGGPWHHTYRVRAGIGKKWHLGLCYEKDAGEKGWVSEAPPHLAGFLHFQGKGLVRDLVLGNYKLSHGLGLVSGTNFFMTPGRMNMHHASLAGLRPSASSAESGYEQGVACRLQQRNISLIFWSSFLRFDLSPSTFITGNPESWWQKQRSSGLYRTMNETAGRNQAQCLHGGTQLLYRYKSFSIGIMGGGQWIGSVPDPPQAEQIKATYFRSFASIHGNWIRGNFQLYGEIASSDSLIPALVLGSEYRFNDFLKAGLLLHQFASGFTGNHNSAYACRPATYHQRGLAMHIQLDAGSKMNIEAIVELFDYLEPRYRVELPSSIYKTTFRISGVKNIIPEWELSWIRKLYEESPGIEVSSVTKIRPLRRYPIDRLQLRFDFPAGNSLRCNSRVQFSHFIPGKKSSFGFALAQQFKYEGTGKFRASVQSIVFHVPDWLNRIYFYEPGFLYALRFPALHGSGQKNTLLLEMRLTEKSAISIRFVALHYFDREIIGTGDNLIEGFKRWEAGWQFKLKL